jgi:hypothetical protein
MGACCEPDGYSATFSDRFVVVDGALTRGIQL